MTFAAEVRTRPDVTDVNACLVRGVQSLRAHAAIADATYQHDQRTHTVSFSVQLVYPIAPHVDAITGHRALHEALEQAGFGDTSLPPYSPVPVRLRIASWPEWGRPR
jgi:hypothetical protein